MDRASLVSLTPTRVTEYEGEGSGDQAPRLRINDQSVTRKLFSKCASKAAPLVFATAAARSRRRSS
jgi:hypothetical protein